MAEKTEKATRHQLREARKRGDAAYSADLTSTAAYAAALAAFVASCGYFHQRFEQLLATLFRQIADARSSIEIDAFISLAQEATLWLVLPSVVVALLVSSAVGLLQTRLMSVEPVLPKPEKLNPATGVQKLFSGAILRKLAKKILEAAIVAFLVYQICVDYLASAGPMLGVGREGLIEMVLRPIAALFALALAVFAVFSLLDFMLQRFEHAKRLRMSKEDVRREHIAQEGNPNVKSARRQTGRELLQGPPRPSYNEPSVVVTNPTHYAVALYFDAATTATPWVVDKGVEHEALRIRHDALRRGIPVREDAALARSLYAQVKVGGAVPPGLFEPVARALAWSVRQRSEREPVAPVGLLPSTGRGGRIVTLDG